jgi:hypothetical protein
MIYALLALFAIPAFLYGMQPHDLLLDNSNILASSNQKEIISRPQQEQRAYDFFYREIARKPLPQTQLDIIANKDTLRPLYTTGSETLRLMLYYAELPSEIRDEIAFKHVGVHHESGYDYYWNPLEKSEFLHSFNSSPFGEAMFKLSCIAEAKKYITPFFWINKTYETISNELLCLYRCLHKAEKHKKTISLSNNEVRLIQHVMPSVLAAVKFGDIRVRWEESPTERIIPSILNGMKIGMDAYLIAHVISRYNFTRNPSVKLTSMLDISINLVDFVNHVYTLSASSDNSNIQEFAPSILSLVYLFVLAADFAAPSYRSPLFMAHGNFQRCAAGALATSFFAAKRSLHLARTNTIAEIYEAKKSK